MRFDCACVRVKLKFCLSVGTTGFDLLRITQFSTLHLLVLTAISAALVWYLTRNSDLASVTMNENLILPLPIDPYPEMRGYWDLLNPREVPLDRVWRNQCLAFANLTSEDRNQITKSISSEMENTLFWRFTRRSAIFAIRNKEPDRVRAALYGLAMLPNQRDFRDVLVSLALLKSAANELEMDLNVFAQAAEIAPKHMANRILEMANRSSGNDWLENSWGRMIVNTSFGIGVVNKGKAAYSPRSDLLSISMRVASALEESDEKYSVESFTIASRFGPGHWMTANPEIKRLKSKHNGAVRIRAKVAASIAQNEVFTIDVIEMQNAETANAMQDAAKVNQSPQRRSCHDYQSSRISGRSWNQIVLIERHAT